jgi:hypothetical protein
MAEEGPHAMDLHHLSAALRKLCRAGALLAAAAWSSAEAAPAPMVCDAGPAVVAGASRDEAAAACAGARDAVAFLAPAGATLPDRIDIELVAVMPAGLPPGAVGCYAMESQRVIVLRFEAFERRRTWMGEPVDRPMHRSIVTHEVAHAISRCHIGPRRLSLLAHEYLAYVTMFATMPPQLRDRVLAHYPGTGYDRDSQINILDYIFDPAAFGAEAYRHWLRHPDGAGFLRRVLEGGAIVDQDERD